MMHGVGVAFDYDPAVLAGYIQQVLLEWNCTIRVAQQIEKHRFKENKLF